MMTRRDRLYIGAALLLQTEHLLRQALGAHGIPHPSLADLIVLAINTSHVAAGKENGPSPPYSGQRGLLSKMR